MTDPVTIAIVAGVSLLTAKQQMDQGSIAASQAKSQAAQAETEATAIELQAKQREADRKAQLNRILASQNAMAGARGVAGFEGSPLAIFETDVEEERLASQRDILGARISAAGARSRGRQQLVQGKVARKQSRFSAGISLLSGGAKASRFGDPETDGDK